MERRHIQDESSAQALEHHWGYADRVVPCTNDAGTCEYLDAVYWMMDMSMLYTFILWAVIGGLLALWVFLRFAKPSRKLFHRVFQGKEDLEAPASRDLQSSVYRAYRTTVVALRRWLLPETLRSIFGNISRLQVLILACILVYLLIFTLVGTVYKTWVTPVKNMPGVYNTRTGFGGFSDRVGAFAYALTPFTVLLGSRESVLSLLTGVPYHHFNFLHRWTGRIIFIQSFLHTLGWTIVEGKLYQPQPKVFKEWIAQQYIIFGIVAMVFMTFLYIFSIRRVIQWTGYEFFRKTHYIVAVLYFAACWGHWVQLACWMIASIGLFFIDRGCRLLRLGLIHTGYKSGNKGFGFRAAQSTLQVFEDGDSTVVRMDFEHNHDPWKPGHHFYLCFPELTIWQSHPFTPSSLPAPHPALPHHTYIIRAEKGETKRLADLAKSADFSTPQKTTPVILTGPYGTSVLDEDNNQIDNFLCIAGGTGVSFTLPIATAAAQAGAATVDLVWIVRKTDNVEWIQPELLDLKARIRDGTLPNLRIKIFVTRDQETAAAKLKAGEKDVDICACSVSSRLSDVLAPQQGFDVVWLEDHHPDVRECLREFAERSAAAGGRCQVAASGPRSLGTDLRSAIAEKSEAGRVWRGDESHDIDLYWDDRMG
ncbi:FAD-binding 8 [Lasiodiplodia theobromae]|uniref:ferric-chelate reductase (NADPH) n=1 Tax=Lasiodiplodia theobromae TaxID=45133 RepID=A0A5N5DSL8_9PEZI|nr:FAD-binding domain-containing protein [Lasiodiplodia theobromae]KAB2580996.1 Ferric reductase transmembrane component 6 [Lasiodiplodia theobromae]KAF4539691.1 FAD-binding domain-containing protein [Lasiodiplodia theobromae]KAF9635772.1 FAD-binding 8 [Lasiodiplodia theobromae]